MAQVLATQLRTPGCSTCTPIYPVYTHRSQPKMAPPVHTQPRHDDIPACSFSSCVVPTFLFASLCQAGRQNSLPRILLASCLENKSFPSPSHSAQLLLLNLIYYWNQFWMAGLDSKSNKIVPSTASMLSWAACLSIQSPSLTLINQKQLNNNDYNRRVPRTPLSTPRRSRPGFSSPLLELPRLQPHTDARVCQRRFPTNPLHRRCHRHRRSLCQNLTRTRGPASRDLKP